MGKVLFVLLIGVVVWLLFFVRRSGKNQRDDSAGAGSSAPRSGAPEQMRPCARCGVHIPSSEACEIASQRGKYSCADPDNCDNRPR